ncbi:ATP-binding protein [Streptomyces blattellae]|uniref:ATP-binding protein n=1 Tax=Streptomyces blattellae TaxID=2569855 RepID=UPI0012BA3216|nr:ATP-binding protein [Streptomyces blattellae]
MPVSENIPEVRLGARLVLASWSVPEDASETVVLILSELAANAVRHARTPGRTFDTSLAYDGEKTIEIEVGDGSPDLPVLKPYDPDATSGRGLLLVEALADGWEVRHRESGKSVWARVVFSGCKGMHGLSAAHVLST